MKYEMWWNGFIHLDVRWLEKRGRWEILSHKSKIKQIWRQNEDKKWEGNKNEKEIKIRIITTCEWKSNYDWYQVGNSNWSNEKW